MQTQSFEVVVRRKVPYVTSLLFHLLLVFGLVLFIIDILFLPTRHASDEMQVAYYILVIPEFVKKAMWLSGIGFLTVLPLYVIARLYRKATLSFLDDRILIEGEKISMEIPVRSLRRVHCMDSHSMSGQSREK